MKKDSIDPMIEAYVRFILTEDEGGGGGFSVATDYGTGLAQIGGKSIGSVIADPIKNALKVGAGEVRKNAQRIGTTAKSAANAAFGEDTIRQVVKAIKEKMRGRWTGFWGNLWLNHNNKIEKIHGDYKQAYEEVDKHTNGNADAVFTAFIFNPGAVMARVFVPMSAEAAYQIANIATDNAVDKLWEEYKTVNKWRDDATIQQEKEAKKKWTKEQSRKDSRLSDLLSDELKPQKNATMAEHKKFLNSLLIVAKSVLDADSVQSILNVTKDEMLKKYVESAKRKGKEIEADGVKKMFFFGAKSKIEEEIKTFLKYGLSKSQEPVSSYVKLYNELTNMEDRI